MKQYKAKIDGEEIELTEEEKREWDSFFDEMSGFFERTRWMFWKMRVRRWFRRLL